MKLHSSAVTQLDQLLQANHSWFRVSVRAGGCNGFEKVFELVHAINEDDHLINNQVVVDPVSWDLLQNSELKYQVDLSGSQFVLVIPEAASSCGCGRSFAF